MGCPPIETLVAITTGAVSDPALVDHVSTCARCRIRSRHHHSDGLLLEEIGAAVRAGDRAAPGGASGAAAPIVDGHEVLREIHRGGQGVVFEALQLEPRRKVALKVLLDGVFGSEERLRRFEREIDLVATLRHPNLVTVHRSGQALDGRHWFTMELVDGVPLDEHAARRRAEGWTTKEVLDLFARICAAVAYAHQRGVVHRDLKPGNVLVDTAGEPRVLDFGVAKALGADASEVAPQATRTGVFVGTIAYAAPEQIRGESDLIDLRTDVYSLGVLLHELLAGEMPYPSKGSMSAAVQAILDSEPAPLRGAGDELAAIVQKALEKERDRRYSSATELLRDVERYLRGEPIDAKRGRTGYLLRKAIARNRVAAAASLLVLVVIVAAAIVSTWFGHEAVVAAGLSKQHSRTAQRVSDFVREMLWNLQPDLAKGRNVTLREVLDEEARRIDTELADEPAARAALHSTIGRTYAALGLDEQAERHCSQSLALCRAGAGDLESEIVDLLELAALRRERGDLGGADELLREAAAALAAHAPVDPALRATVLNGQALVRFTSGDPDGGEPLFQEALALLRGCGQLKSAATTLLNLGLMLYDRGDYAGSEARLREGLGLSRDAGDLELVSVGRGLRHLSRALAMLGRLDEAIAAAEESLELCRRLLGESEPMAILVLAELASLRARRDGYPAAAALHARARELRPALAERAQRTCANALHELAQLAETSGDLDEADELFEEAVRHFERSLGREHSYVAVALIGHSGLLATQGRLSESEARAREAVELQRRLLASADPRRAAGLLNLAWILHCRGEEAEAESLYRAVLAEQRARGGDTSLELATTLHGLSEVLAARGGFDEAIPLAREALAIRRTRLEPDDPDVAMGLDALGRALLAHGRADEARALLEEALAIRRKRYPQGHLHLVWSLDNVGAWHYYRRDYEVAEALFQEAVDMARDFLGDEHPELGVALGNLASAFVERRDFAPAAPLLAESWEILRATRGASHPQTVRMLRRRIEVHEALGERAELAECRALLRESGAASSNE